MKTFLVAYETQDGENEYLRHQIVNAKTEVQAINLLEHDLGEPFDVEYSVTHADEITPTEAKRLMYLGVAEPLNFSDYLVAMEANDESN